MSEYVLIPQRGRYWWTGEDRTRIDRLAGTLRIYGYLAAAQYAEEIYAGLGPREVDRLMTEFGARLQLATILGAARGKPVAAGLPTKKSGSLRSTPPGRRSRRSYRDYQEEAAQRSGTR